MSVCWNVFSKVPWSCWYCEYYLNDSFKFLRTTELRNTVFCCLWVVVFFLFYFEVFSLGCKEERCTTTDSIWMKSHHCCCFLLYRMKPDVCKWHGFSWYTQGESWLLTAFLQRPFHEEYQSLSLWSGSERQLSNTAAYMMSISIVLLDIL